MGHVPWKMKTVVDRRAVDADLAAGLRFQAVMASAKVVGCGGLSTQYDP
jgi:hypothetical protein